MCRGCPPASHAPSRAPRIRVLRSGHIALFSSCATLTLLASALRLTPHVSSPHTSFSFAPELSFVSNDESLCRRSALLPLFRFRASVAHHIRLRFSATRWRRRSALWPHLRAPRLLRQARQLYVAIYERLRCTLQHLGLQLPHEGSKVQLRRIFLMLITCRRLLGSHPA